MVGRMTITAGILVKSDIRKNLKRKASDLNIKITIDEERGFLSSELFVTLEGDSGKVELFKKEFVKLCNE